MSLHRLVRALILGLFVALLAAAPAALAERGPASPTLQSSEPGDGEKLHEPPSEVSLTFSEPLDASSTIIVTDECDRRVDSGEVTVQLTEMSVPLEKTPLGHYEVVYEAKGIGGVTGTTNGSIHFELVHGGKSCDGSSSDHDHHDKKKDHDGHKKDGKKDHDHHDMDDHDTDDHDSDHSSMSGHSNDHSDMSHPMGHGKHGSDHKNHDAQKDEKPNPPQDRTLANPPGPVNIPADGKAVAIALSVTSLLGALGGWILRIAA